MVYSIFTKYITTLEIKSFFIAKEIRLDDNLNKWINRLKDIKNEVIIIEGYFQSECFLSNDLKMEILSIPTTLILPEGHFVHIRRGDYIGNTVHQLNLLSYFKSSESYFDSPRIIFTDDPVWCKEHFKDDFIVPQSDALDTLRAMALCKGGICSNSSFSWIGAWLQPRTLENRNIIIMPRPWFQNKIFENQTKNRYPYWVIIKDV